MNIMSTIFIIVFCLIYFLFPMWCAIVMKLLCKSFSDKFIVRFLSIACALPIIVRGAVRDYRRLEFYEMPLLIYMAFILLAALMCIWFCSLLAKAGVIIINKRNPNHHTHSIADSARSE